VTPLELPAPDGWAGWLQERCDGRIDRARALAAELTSGPAADEVVLERWNDLHLALSDVFAAASLFTNVHPDGRVRDLAERAEQEARRLVTDIGLDRGLYEVLAAVDEGALDPPARRMLQKSLLDFRRSGVDREDEVRERLRVLSARATELGQAFAKNIRDGVGRFTVAADRLDGLPADFREGHPTDADGLVELTTDYPDYVPVMTFATDRELRRQMAEAFLDRAWPVNGGVLHELLEVRRETATLLGYPDWPSFDAEVKMIGSGAAIPAFVDRVAALAEPTARRDFGVLLDRARADHSELDGLTAVDKLFYSEVVRREQLDVDAQDVRRYLDFAKVRRGLLDVTGRLLGLRYTQVEGCTTWHEDVVAYDVHLEGAEEPVGRIHLDLHPRPGKYSHAAQFTLVDGLAGRQLPEGVLVCNFPRGLMEHDQVVTLFHEFGHLVHHVLGGRQRWVRFSGVATEWDFVEAPSQMLEEWAWDHEVLGTFATDTAGEPVPAELVERMRRADEFGKGFAARTQMFYAALAYTFHQDVPDDLTASMIELQGRYDLFDHLPGTHFHASFGHLGGYTSAYYTYMWSLVIAKDLFSAFDCEDLFEPEVARRYRDEVLAAGGSGDAATLVERFLGRPYGFESFETWLAS
jgi:thimet oligopeptidase